MKMAWERALTCCRRSLRHRHSQWSSRGGHLRPSRWALSSLPLSRCRQHGKAPLGASNLAGTLTGPQYHHLPTRLQQSLAANRQEKERTPGVNVLRAAMLHAACFALCALVALGSG